MGIHPLRKRRVEPVALDADVSDWDRPTSSDPQAMRYMGRLGGTPANVHTEVIQSDFPRRVAALVICLKVLRRVEASHIVQLQVRGRLNSCEPTLLEVVPSEDAKHIVLATLHNRTDEITIDRDGRDFGGVPVLERDGTLHA